MKKKKVISAIVLFGLALSSCKQCPKPKPEPNTIDRTTPASLIPNLTIPEEIHPTPILRRLDLNLTELDRLIERLPYGSDDRELFKTASKALKHVADVINNPAHANRDAYRVAKGFSSSAGSGFGGGVFVDSHDDLIRNAREAARHSVLYSQYVVGQVAHIPFSESFSSDADVFAAGEVRDFARTAREAAERIDRARRFRLSDTERILDEQRRERAERDIVNIVNKLAEKVEELEEFV